MALAPTVISELEHYCPNCGDWFSFLHFDFEEGWCIECSLDIDHPPQCIHCGSVLTKHDIHRSTCHICRREAWLELHSDELEFLIVVKGYKKADAFKTLIRLLRPICNSCGKPIKGAKSDALFCKVNKRCRSAYNKYRKITKSGLTPAQALAIIRGQDG